MIPEAVIDEIETSGFEGARRRRASRPGLKWDLCRQSPGTPKSLICNGDAFMDRSILEGDPFSVARGHGHRRLRHRRSRMAISGYAPATRWLSSASKTPAGWRRSAAFWAGASRDAFQLQYRGGRGRRRLYLRRGDGPDRFHRGQAGHAATASPYPATSGLWGKPSVTDNVKTLVSVPLIISRGADWYAGIGAQKARGTAVISLVGKVENNGLVEVPMGTLLQDVIYDIGGRHTPRQAAEGRPDRRPLRRFSVGQAPRLYTGL